jgi:NADP-dependent 3-hydroxy acid dehydrogenase YdfG
MSEPTRIVITGATSGIGAELARQYAAPGVRLALVGRRAERLDEVAHEVRSRGGQAFPYVLDVCDAEGMLDMAAEFTREHAGADLVIANAGGGVDDDLRSGDPRPLTKLIDINVNGVLNTLVPFVPAMKAQGSGHLVAVASVAGFRALPKHTVYSATKIAVRTLMEGFGMDLAPLGITVTSINPGFVVSELTDRQKDDFPMPFLLDTEEACRRIRGAIARKKTVFTFPFPMAVAARLMAVLPRFAISAIASFDKPR